jgi:hypothetical protein
MICLLCIRHCSILYSSFCSIIWSEILYNVYLWVIFKQKQKIENNNFQDLAQNSVVNKRQDENGVNGTLFFNI